MAAAEFIQKEKGFTDPARTIIKGHSNGGMLMLAVANQRPELFGAVIGQVPLADMLRFDKFTIGHFLASDYGRTEENALDTLVKYSPYHNVKEQMYPPLLILTGDHDDRVVPVHAYKFLAEVQHRAGGLRGQRPLLGRIYRDVGHG